MKKYNSSKFDFYEVVMVVTDNPIYNEINGKEGAILGIAQNEDGLWGYAVNIFNEIEGWDIPEEALKSMGRLMKREDFYSGDSIKVSVDADSGIGTMIDND